MRRLTPHLVNLLSANQFFDTLTPAPSVVPAGRGFSDPGQRKGAGLKIVDRGERDARTHQRVAVGV